MSVRAFYYVNGGLVPAPAAWEGRNVVRVPLPPEPPAPRLRKVPPRERRRRARANGRRRARSVSAVEMYQPSPWDWDDAPSPYVSARFDVYMAHRFRWGGGVRAHLWGHAPAFDVLLYLRAGEMPTEEHARDIEAQFAFAR